MNNRRGGRLYKKGFTYAVDSLSIDYPFVKRDCGHVIVRQIFYQLSNEFSKHIEQSGDITY